jgi:hypothetical protein
MLGIFDFIFRHTEQSKIMPGTICTVNDGEGFYRVAKVLVIDAGVHMSLYKNKWKERPQTVDINTLSLGTIHDKDGFGMGHLPLTKHAFAAWEPVVIGYEEVKQEELDGYEIWKDSGGGYFGKK